MRNSLEYWNIICTIMKIMQLFSQHFKFYSQTLKSVKTGTCLIAEKRKHVSLIKMSCSDFFYDDKRSFYVVFFLLMSTMKYVWFVSSHEELFDRGSTSLYCLIAKFLPLLPNNVSMKPVYDVTRRSTLLTPKTQRLSSSFFF